MAKTKAALLLCAPLLLGGCVATQQNIGDLQTQLNSLNSSLTQMQKNQAELNAKMDKLSGNLVAHSESLRDFDRGLSKLSSKLDDMEQALDSKIAAVTQNVKAQQDAASAQATALLPSKIYGESYTQLMKKSYERSAQGFALYIEKFPHGELVESAYYYMGEAYSGLNRWQDAAVAYATILEQFKDSQFTAPARLKYALCILKLPGNNKDEAVKYLKSIIQDFPGTQQARLAEDYLKEVDPPVAAPEAAPAKPAPAKAATPVRKAAAKPVKRAAK